MEGTELPNDAGMTSRATDIYRMPSGKYLKTMVVMFGRRFVYVCAAALAVSVMLGAWVDWRCFILALMVVLLICPALMAWLYFYYGLRPECFVNVMPHYIGKGKEGISVTILKTDEEENYEEVTYIFGFDNIQRKKYIVGSDSVIFPFTGEYKGFIWIPAEAFADASDFINFVSWMSDSDIR